MASSSRTDVGSRITDRARRFYHILRSGVRPPALIWFNAKYLLFYAADCLQDRWFGIDTRAGFRGYQSLERLEVVGDRSSTNPYVPTPYGTLRRLFAALPSDLSAYSFVDFGSGKGRALIMAARYDFKEVIGMEFAPALHEEAVRNIACAADDGRTRSILCDAREFQIPNNPCVLFFFNPFGIEVMKLVAGNIASSFRDNPRTIIVSFYNRTVMDAFESLGIFRPMKTVREGWPDSLSHSGRYSIDLLRASPDDGDR